MESAPALLVRVVFTDVYPFPLDLRETLPHNRHLLDFLAHTPNTKLIDSMVRRAGLTVLAFIVVLLAGCGSTQPIIYPAETQTDAVERTTRGGYDFLRSTKGQNTIIVSLRTATPSYVQAYVSISNQGETPLAIDPSSIAVVAQNGTEKTFSAYASEEVPGVVQRSAQASSEFVHHMNEFSLTSAEVTGEAKRGGGRGGYGTSSEDETSYLDLMLQEQVIQPRDVASGLVYTPFNRGFDGFRIEIPTGKTTHTFRYTIHTNAE